MVKQARSYDLCYESRGPRALRFALLQRLGDQLLEASVCAETLVALQRSKSSASGSGSFTV